MQQSTKRRPQYQDLCTLDLDSLQGEDERHVVHRRTLAVGQSVQDVRLHLRQLGGHLGSRDYELASKLLEVRTLLRHHD